MLDSVIVAIHAFRKNKKLDKVVAYFKAQDCV